MTEKILIVDDDPETVKFISLLLQRLGYQAHEAQNGMDALKLAHELLPDLVVLDVMMPGMDGFEVARSLRRHPETALIPILMFTVKTQVEDKLAGYESGVDIYLTKPIHPVELQANIKALLTQKKARTDTLSKRGYMVGMMAAKGGLGVSTVALNLAIAFKQSQAGKVIAAELRPGQGSWGEELGFLNPIGLENLLRMNHTDITPVAIEKNLSTTPFGVPLLLASNESCEVECITALAQYEAILKELFQMADLIILDVGTNFHPAFDIINNICNEIILVTEPQPVSVKRTRVMVGELRARDYGSSKALTVVTLNRTRAEMTLTVSQIEEMLGQSVALGFPPATELAYQSATRATPMYMLQPDGILAKQFDLLAKNLSQRRGSRS